MQQSLVLAIVASRENATTRFPARRLTACAVRSCAAVGLALVVSFAFAGDDPQPTIVVTATRSAQTVDDSLASVTVLTRTDIERSQAPDLIDLLRMQTGVDLARTGGPGQSTSLFLRGTGSNQTLVLIDGIRVASTDSGLYDFAHLPLDQIERIEIVRGPRASYWGSDAIGGVIQIFTREPDGVEARGRAGSDGRYGASAGYGARGARGAFGLTLGGEAFEGYSAQNEAGFSFDPDDDGYHNRNASLRGEVAAGPQIVSASFLSTDADIEFDQGETAAIDRSGGITVAGPMGSRWNHSVTLGATHGELDTPAFGNRFESRRQTVDWQHEVALSATDVLGFGVNLMHEDGRTLDTFSGTAVYDESRNNRAAHASWRRHDAALDLELAGRLDDNSAFGSEATFQAGAGWEFGAAVRGFTSFGEGFRAPTLNELYSPGFGGLFAGNPTLEPERSRSAELGLDFTPEGPHSFKLRAFRTRVRDLVAFEGGDTFQAVNVRRAAIDGAELGYAWRADTLGFDANYTWQDTEDESTGEALLRRPRQKLAALLTHRLGSRFEYGIEGIWVSSRRDIGIELPAYALANLRLAWRFAPQLRLEARLENAFDREYELAHGFNTPDRSLLVALAYNGN